MSLNPSGKDVCNNFIHFNSVSCLLMILNFDEEFYHRLFSPYGIPASTERYPQTSLRLSEKFFFFFFNIYINCDEMKFMVYRIYHRKLHMIKRVFNVHAFLAKNRNVVIKNRHWYFINESSYIL